MTFHIHQVPTQRLNIWKELKAAESQASGSIPVVRFGRQHQQYAALKLRDFLKLLTTP